MDPAVCCVPSLVWLLTSRMRWMLCATDEAEAAWFSVVREFLRHLADADQRHAGLIGQLGTAHHTLRTALHGRHRIVRVGLNGLDQGRDLARGLGRAFSQTLHLFGNHREAAPRLPMPPEWQRSAPARWSVR